MSDEIYGILQRELARKGVPPSVDQCYPPSWHYHVIRTKVGIPWPSEPE